MNILEAKHIFLTYQDGTKALDDVSLQVKQGEVFSLLGENGAGKSSLIHVLTTFIKPNSGTISLCDHEHADAKWIRSHIACVAQQVSIESHLTLKENFMLHASLYGMDKNTAAKQMETLIHLFQLNDYQHKPVKSYSGGIKRKLDIAMSMMSKPDILFLDEPSVGLDIISRHMLWDMIEKIRKIFQTTIFLTTHYLEEAQRLSDTICFIQKGHIQVQSSLSKLCEQITQKWIYVKAMDPSEHHRIKEILKKHADFMEKENGIYLNSNELSVNQVMELLMREAILIHTVEIVEPSLDDIFLNFTKKGGNA